MARYLFSVIDIAVDKSIKAFTLMEVLLVMALTGMVVLLGISTVSYFTRLYHDIDRAAQDQQSIVSLQTRLSIDMNNARKATWDNELKLTGLETMVSYRFMDNAIVRADSINADTIRITYEKPVLVYNNQNELLVDRISITCHNNEASYVVDVFKEYPVGIAMEGISNAP